jgi:hypothetical protein
LLALARRRRARRARRRAAAATVWREGVHIVCREPQSRRAWGLLRWVVSGGKGGRLCQRECELDDTQGVWECGGAWALSLDAGAQPEPGKCAQPDLGARVFLPPARARVGRVWLHCTAQRETMPRGHVLANGVRATLASAR